MKGDPHSSRVWGSPCCVVCGTQDQLVRQAEVRAVSACWDGDIIPPRQKARVGGTWLSQPLAM